MKQEKNVYQIMTFSLSGNEASHNLVRAVACGGASGARPPISRLAPLLLHTSNTVFSKCGFPFWFLAPPYDF